jgi:hypothetical protein
MEEFVNAYNSLVTPEAIKILSEKVHRQYMDMKNLYPKDIADIGEDFVKQKIAQKLWSEYVGNRYKDNNLQFQINTLWVEVYDYYNKHY